MNARDVNIFGSSSVRKKLMLSATKITEVISFVSGLGSPGENFITGNYYTAVFHVCKQELLDFSERKQRAGRK